MIHHSCPNCGAQLNVPDQYAGQTVKCGGCGAMTQCPMEDGPPSIPVAPTQAYAPPPPEIPEGSKSQAIASLVCAILSFACFGPLASIPAVILGHLSLSNIKKGAMPASAHGMAVAGLIIGYINLVFVLLFMLVMPAILLPALARAREAARRSSCQNNLKQMGLVYKMFANESKKQAYPRISATPGQLMSAKNEIFPEYLTDPKILVCPSEPDGATRLAHPDTLVDDESYFYLGYAVSDDKDMAAFCAAYKEHMAKGLPPDDDLQVPPGTGSGGGSIIYRLREGVERFFITDINNPAGASIWQSKLPILIERPENHVPMGGNVLFMDGHVEFIKYGTHWPMTDRTMNALKELDAMGK